MLYVVSVYAGDGDVGPYGVVPAQDHSWVGNAVASQGGSFAENGSKLSEPAPEAFTVQSKVHLAAVVAQVAQFCTGPKVDVTTQNGIPNVVEMRRLGTWKENGMLHLGGMAHHSV